MSELVIENIAVGSPLLSRLFLTSLELAVLCIAVALIIKLARVQEPRMKALLWLIVLAKPLLGLMIGTPLPLFFFRAPHGVSSNGLPASLQSEPSVTESVQPSAAHTMPVSNSAITEHSKPAAAQETKDDTRPASSNLPLVSSIFSSLPLSFWLTSLWLGGAGIMLALTLRDRRRIRQLCTASTTPAKALEDRYLSIAREIGLRRVPALRVTSQQDSPALVGLLRPVVLLPQWLTDLARAQAADWFLRHELMHAKMNDPIGLVVRRLAEILFFFHPAVWWAGRRWEEAMEMACDRALLHDTADAKRYAEELFRVLENQHACNRLSLSAGLFATRTQIGKRIAALMDNPLRFSSHLNPAALSGLALITLIGFSVGIGWRNDAHAEEPTNEAQTAERVKKTADDLRSLHVGFESYKVDNGSFPDQIHLLTTPVGYISGFIPDPFADAIPPNWQPPAGQSPPNPGPGFLKMFFAPDFKSLRIYSVGPDGIDSLGAVAYDPTNGTASPGDVVRTIALERYQVYEDQELSAKVKAQQEALAPVKNAVEAWYMKHGSLPENLEVLKELVPQNVAMPEDTFSPGHPVRYRLNTAKDMSVIYSVGPDGKDDDGRAILGRFKKGEMPSGDITEELYLKNHGNMSGLERRFPETRQAPKDDPLLNALLQLKEKDGKDNAMIHYATAVWLMGSIPDKNQMDLLDKTLQQGWSEESRQLLPLFERYKAFFEELRKGIALDYARNASWENGPQTPVPNFLYAQTSVKLLCLEGRYLESEGHYDQALTDYLDALTVARDYGVRDCVMIGALISANTEKITLEQIGRLAASEKLDRPALDRLQARLRAIEASHEPYFSSFWNFSIATTRMWLSKVRDNSSDAAQWVPKEIDAKDVARNSERILKEFDQFWNFQRAYFETDYWKRDTAKYEQERKTLLNSVYLYNKRQSESSASIEPNVRYLTARAKLGQARLATALAAYKLDKGRFPAALNDLVPAYLDVKQIDPFNGESLHYRPLADGANFDLWSAGPDMKDDAATLEYDPRKGSTSGGDIALKQ